MSNFLTSIIEDRWSEAISEPTIQRWHSLAFMAAQLADAMEENYPDDIIVPCLRAVYEASYARMLAMQPAKEAA